MRLPGGGLIDRARPLGFSFDGRHMSGFAGDTLASALVANDVRLVGRSFKYHRPRGIMGAGRDEPNALVTLGTGDQAEPNLQATMVELTDGLVATSQNRWPSLVFDVGSIGGGLAPLIPGGFYYKTFMWPGWAWERVYEPLIRRAAGLGRASGLPDPGCYEHVHTHCDVLVVGAGPAGLAAALAAARAGARVVLAEEDFAPGGQLLADSGTVDGRPAAAWAGDTWDELAALKATLLPRTAVFGAYDGGTYGAVERLGLAAPRQRIRRIVARRVVVATGANERPLMFVNNDLPGVMLASATRSYTTRFAAVPGRKAVVFTATDEGWRTVATLTQAGLTVVAVVDPRPEVAAPLIAPAKRAGAAVHLGATVAALGGRALEAVRIVPAHGTPIRVAADLLAVSGGWSPAIGLAQHHGHRPQWCDARHAFLAHACPPGMTLAGAAAGIYGLADCLADGARAGAEAAGAVDRTGTQPAPPQAENEPTGSAPPQRDAPKGKVFVDFQNDVTATDIALAHREGFRSIEHLKRYTTLGMGTEQGRTSNVNGIALMAGLTGRPIAEAGTPIARPPATPVSVGALAGTHRGVHFGPSRRTAGHDWATGQGAVFTDAGYWRRAQYFPREGEADWLATVTREVNAVRGGVGVCDVSTLGKIEVVGPDAGVFLDRLYAGTMSTLPVGRARYGLMLREDGFVLDDGTATRFAADRFVISTTTAAAARVIAHVEFARRVLWPGLDVGTVSVTEQWAQFAVAGPRARAVIAALLPGFDLSNAAFPFIAAAATEWDGVPLRLARLSFSGELAYELAIPARHGDALVRAVHAAGATPYGTEALGVMRIEKGHVGGGELDGRTTAHDLGLGRMLSTKKDYIGRLMAIRPALTDPMRPTLVGLAPLDRSQRLRAGAHLLPEGAAATAANDQGHVSSAAFSATLGHWIALGLLANGPARHGERVRAYDPVRRGDVLVEVRPPVFVDPEGARLRD